MSHCGKVELIYTKCVKKRVATDLNFVCVKPAKQSGVKIVGSCNPWMCCMSEGSLEYQSKHACISRAKGFQMIELPEKFK